VNIRSIYSERERFVSVNDDPSLAKQASRKECDINFIMEKYQKTGAISHFQKHSGSYDFASGIDFQEAMQLVAEGRSVFEDLPSSIRTRFKNDPGEFLDFCQDPDNLEEMRELGLTRADLPEAEAEVPVVPVPAAESVSEPVEGDSQLST